MHTTTPNPGYVAKVLLFYIKRNSFCSYYVSICFIMIYFNKITH